jgi:hypothetical protein
MRFSSLSLRIHILISKIWLTIAQMITCLNENGVCVYPFKKRLPKALNKNQDQCFFNQAEFPAW